jgi:hypothetical protein
MQRTADFHDAIANDRLLEAAGDVDDATRRDTAVDRLDAHATAGDAPIAAFCAPVIAVLVPPILPTQPSLLHVSLC